MAVSYKKVSIGGPRPSMSRPPAIQPLKTKFYTKAAGEDSTKFFGGGFGDTGLVETPSIIGMGKNAK